METCMKEECSECEKYKRANEVMLGALEFYGDIDESKPNNVVWECDRKGRRLPFGTSAKHALAKIENILGEIK
jgi:hypothetical protein